MTRKLTALFLCALLAVACVPAALAAVPQTFTFASNNDLTTLDVSLMNDEMSGLVQYAVNESLLRHENGGIVPGIAQSYDVSDDGLVYTFHLRDASWADGQPVTAGDFAYSFLRTLDPATGSAEVESFDDVRGAIAYYSGEAADASGVGIAATDEKTLVITLESPSPFFIESLARGINYYPIRQDYVETYGAAYATDPSKFIGCGPFVLTEWVQTASLTFTKSETYWNADAITLDTAVELIVGDENTRTGMYDLGEVDALYGLSATQTLSYPDYKSKGTDSTLQYLAFMSPEGGVLSNQNLRLALSWGINRQAIVAAICAPGSFAMDRVIIPSQTLDGESIAAQYPASSLVPAQGDFDKAKEYLAAALAELGLASAADLPAIRYVAMESATHKAMAEALQAQWAQNLGVDVSIDIRPVPQAIGALLSGDFDIFLVSQATGINPDGILGNFIVGGGNNYAHWEDQTYSDLIAAQKYETDLVARFTTLSQAEQYILDAAAIAPLWVPGSVYIAQDYVQGLTFGPWTGGIEFNYVTILEQ